MEVRNNLIKMRSGFTIIELIIVIAIIAVMAGIGIPAFSKFLPNYQLKSAAFDIFSVMQSTKAEAIKSNASRSITFDTGNKSYTNSEGTVYLTDYGKGVDFGGGNATKNATTSGGSDFSGGVSYISDTVTFNPRGTGNSGWIYLENSKGTAYAIGSLTSGVIRMRKWTGSDWE